MKRNALLLIVGLLVAALFVLLQVLFIVREGEVAVLTTFGKPQDAITKPGLYCRWPWPVQKVYTYDNRTHVVEGPFEETLTKDGKNVLVAVYAGWQINEPKEFLERVGTTDQAERNLDGLLRHYKSAILGQYTFGSLVNVKPEAIQFEEIERNMLAAVQPEAADRYGIKVAFLGIRKIGLPESITKKVFERMQAERAEIAERYRSEGEGEAIKIRARADSQRDQILSQAEAEAQRIRAAGDAKAAEYFEAFKKDEEFALFLQHLAAMEQILKSNSTVVLTADTEPFNLLRGAKELPSAGGGKSK